jgi:hypothetical protein
MDLDESFVVEGLDSSFSVTNIPLKTQHKCGICGMSVDTKFKAARLRIHANFHENFENVFECVIL